MPMAAPLIAGAALSGGLAWASGAVVLGLTGAGLGAAVFAASIALGFINQALQPNQKPKMPGIPDFSGTATDRTQMVRQPITARSLVIGEKRVSGPICFVASTDDNKYLHLVVALAGHEVQEIGTVYLNDEPVFSDDLDGSGNVDSGKFDGKVRIKKHLGTADQAADADLIGVGGWTSAHRLRGIAYVYVRLEFDRELFPTRIPNVSAQVKGAKLFDPRDRATRWSMNPALAVRHYLAHATYGLAAADGDLEDGFTAAAANICDEIVAVKVATDPLEHTVSSVDTTDDWIEVSGELLLFQTGDRVSAEWSTSAPGGLTNGAEYFVIVKHERSVSDADHPSYDRACRVQLATNYANALAGTAIDLTSAPSGTGTLTKTGEPRYRACGTLSSANAPADNLSDLYSAMGGRVVNAGGTWRILAASYQPPPPDLHFEEGDFRGSISARTRNPRRERFNAVKGTYSSPQNFDQPSDYPPVTSATYEAADGGARIFKDIDLPMTPSASMAQRLAKIELERHRREITATLRLKLCGLKCQAGDFITVTNSRRGWTDKVFEVAGWRLVVERGADEAPYLGVDVDVSEIDSAAFTWDAETEETTTRPAARSILPNPFAVSAPVSVALSTVTVLDQTGAQVHRIRAAWTQHTNQFVLQDGKIELQYKASADSTWLPTPLINGAETEGFTPPVPFLINHDVRVRARNYAGVVSAWQTISNYTVGASGAGANLQIDDGLITDLSVIPVDEGGVLESVDTAIDYETIA